jgi:putative DNA primase/helicase
MLEVFNGDAELVSYMQRVIGYSLTGRTREEVFFLLYGEGRNGKGTMVETLQAILGDYADTVAPEVLLQKTESGGNTPELAKLKGIRFAPSSETDTKRKLAEALVKRITGGDSISVCAKYENPFTYKPEFKLWLATNKKPSVSGTDLGIWSRIKMIPFLAKFEGASKDLKLKETLRAEASGILAWSVRGSVEWYQNGLGTCKAVNLATDDYRNESDLVARFIADCLEISPTEKVSAESMFVEYEKWKTDNDGAEKTRAELKRELEAKGLQQGKRTKHGNFWLNIKLKPVQDDEATDETCWNDGAVEI